MAGNDEPTISVQSDLKRVIADLIAIQSASEGVGASLKDAGKEIGDSINDNIQKTEKGVGRMGKVARNVLNSLIDDFKVLSSVAQLGAGLKLSSQFSGNIKETLSLTDAIRKMGGTFGVASNDFGAFQSKLTKGLGQLGLSSEVAVKAMEGLIDTPVRGEEAVQAYAETAGKLASVTRQQGKEGELSRGFSNVLTARGEDPNNLAAMKGLSENLRNAYRATGKSPTELLQSMERMFAQMNVEDKKQFSPDVVTKIASIAQVAGPSATKFLEDYLSKGNIGRESMNQQGFKGIIGPGGLDIEKFKKSAEDIFTRTPGDRQMAAQTLGLDEDAAKGFVALYDSLKRVDDAQKQLRKTTGSLAEDFRKSAGPVEAFQRNVNRVKGMLSQGVGDIAQGAADLLSSAAESDTGAAVVSGGAAAAAAILTGGGLRGLMGTATGQAKKAATEAATGKSVQDVYVVNASEIGGMGLGGAGGKLASTAAMAGRAGLVGLAGVGGYAAGSAINEYGPTFQGKTSEGFEGGLVERLFYKLDRLIGGEASRQIDVGIKIENQPKNLRATPARTRGASAARSPFSERDR